MSRLGVAVWFALSISTPAHAHGQDALFDEGNRLYQEEDYAGAVEAYEQIIADGYESGILYYNLGNAYFKLGELGQAILQYERARRLVPRDDDVRANLELARSLTTDDIAARPPFLPFAVIRWWVDLVPRHLLIVVVGSGYLIAMVGLVVVVLRRGTPLTVWSGRASIVGGAICMVFGINLLVREMDIGEPREAIIMAESATVQSAPADDPDLQLFTIHEGTKVELDQQSDEWVEVVLEDGRVGWVPAGVLTVI